MPVKSLYTVSSVNDLMLEINLWTPNPSDEPSNWTNHFCIISIFLRKFHAKASVEWEPRIVLSVYLTQVTVCLYMF